MIQHIDSTKIGNFIKQALKERHLTQDDLAKHLHISKSAVSQNLNGKSSFDLENLLKISTLLNITLDEMINQKIEVDTHISEYERVVKKGQSELETIHPDKLNIKSPDIYGYILIDYIIKYDRADMMTYLLKHGLDVFHRNASDSIHYYGKLLTYVAEKKLPFLEVLIKDFIFDYGSLKALDEPYIETLLKTLNQISRKPTLKNLLSLRVGKSSTKLKVLKTESKLPVASHQAWIEWIAKYQLNVFLELFIQDYADYYDYEPLINQLTKHNYEEGLTLYFTYLEKKHYMKLETKLYKFQEAISYLIQRNYPDFALKAVNLSLYSDYNAAILLAIESGLENLAIKMMESDKSSIKFRVILKKALDHHMKTCLDTYLEYASNDDLNYLLSEVSQDHLDLALLLLSKGALYEASYIKKETLNTINHLIKTLRKDS